jgi:3-deoxy-D-manno-octulosonate 8-phosphate phosphatase (KDO 8-P phosphatase)
MSLEALCRPIKLILSDVDGVMTDGGIIFDNQGIETKRFHVRDGMGIRLWQRAGGKFGIITSRNSHIVRLRATELGIDIIRQGFAEKLPAAREVFAEQSIHPSAVAYIGDDLPDVPVMNAVGVAIAVADACDEAKAAAKYITKLPGGSGAVREAIEFILKTQQRWDEVAQKYVS